jgi:hypothetical protein
LSVNELRIRAKTHLALEVPDNFLEFVIPVQKQQLKEKIAQQLTEENYQLLDFDLVVTPQATNHNVLVGLATGHQF